jgi:hypothetical protein
MDVFVLLNLWNESATVAGAATSLADAELIADRHGQSYRWADWWTDPSGVRRRRALWGDGSPHYGFMQLIAQVPLAGNARRISESLIDESVMMRAIAPIRTGQPVRYGEEVQEIGRTWGAP